ncbi:hypothetical protein [Thioclava sp. GXIMD2076]|uniref:hypothetical protein n=1 Tax=Thioclava sp. GXIMD2076 TaxID=3131931 RepID=UPI0030CBEDD2
MTTITDNGADYAAYAAIMDVPLIENCLSWGFGGRSLLQSRRNHASGGLNLQGTDAVPLIAENYVRGGTGVNAGGINLVAETSEITVFAVARSQNYGTNTVSSYIGNKNTTGQSGLLLGTGASGASLQAYFSESGTPALRGLTIANTDNSYHASWKCLVGQFSASGRLIADMTHGFRSPEEGEASLTGTRILGTGVLKAGADYSNVATTSGDVAAWAVFNKWASDDERDFVYRVLRGICRRRGILGV